ncbi:ABC-type Fe3+-hydroxamate transport system substrate-binding protein [Methanomicrobium sp. W14]|uniref:ABC transporter substrate-binding protein n=1 Tax=Methanomicrobium sp. W14 TaxID=2817839 RepID=UPI001AE2895A|nr:ABC transporter substrate-binding protein [Methanomicrobium sp. W14]MBP2133079.1 ABC-type Fe3+-hydroxamate transport system substrate-binding protein [Methanomicrobium sp. W14]
MKIQIAVVFFLLMMLVSFSGCLQSQETPSINTSSDEQFRTVTDSRGVEVVVPAKIDRVATVSDGLVEEVMYILGVDNTLVGLGSKGLQYEAGSSYSLENGKNLSIEGGKNVALALSPQLKELPLFMDYGSAMNIETLASLKPDVVIMRLGSSAYLSGDDENAQKSIQMIESLGIPVVVLYSPECYENSSPTEISDEIRIIGSVFGEEEKAEDVIARLELHEEIIKERTQNITEDQKPDVLVLGLSPTYRTETAAGIAWGLKTTESYIIEDVVNAKNAYRSDTGSFQVVSTEQILAMDPDVIILGTASGYHPPDELYYAPYYKNLREIDAVKNHRVTSLPYAPRNAAERLEYPVEMMVIAKSAYPEKFEDVNINDWVISFYQDIYGVNSTKAEELRTAQLIDWSTGE